MTVPIANLLGVNRADRKLRAYAYLTASFREHREVSDVFDCLIPFMISALEGQNGKPLDLDAIRLSMESLGLRVPVYVLEQLVGRLSKRAYVVWDRLSRNYIVKIDPERDISNSVGSTEIDDAFDEIEAQLSAFASEHGMSSPPMSASWTDALINFLRSEKAQEFIRSIDIRGALIGDTANLESFVVASFIQASEERNPKTFSSIVTIFTGVLIEDFIGNIQDIGDPSTFSKLSIYYDTTILLRIVGMSGGLLQSATMEMHRTLQDLGCRTYYFDFIEVETLGVLNAILSAYDAGLSLYNETAEAIFGGEITISDIRDVVATLAVRLGSLNIFPFVYHFASRKIENTFQIDEVEFSESLMSAAIIQDRTYKRQNAETDARSAAIIIRLRKGVARREVSASGHIFVSKNVLLQRVCRTFAINHLDPYDEISIPPIFTVGQITTIAWISSTKKLEPHKVSKELLASCYSAVRPSAGWADEFSKALISFQQDSPAIVEQRANQHFFLQTARSMAKDVSLGQAAVLRKINLVDVFTAAAQAASVHADETQKRIEQLEAKIRKLESERNRDPI